MLRIAAKAIGPLLKSRSMFNPSKIMPCYMHQQATVGHNYDTTNLFVTISKLLSYGFDLELPRPFVIGSQSDGKSATVSAVIGYDLLPKKMDICTLKSTTVTTINKNEFKIVVNDKEFIVLNNAKHETVVENAKREIERLNDNKQVNNISVIIYSPKLIIILQ